MTFLLLRTHRNGFTVIELLVALAVTGIMLIALFSFFSLGFQTFYSGRQRIDLQQNVRLAADFITREVRYANELEIVTPGEIRFTLHGCSNQYRIKQKGDELVLLTNDVENKIAYHIRELELSYCVQDHVLHYVIHGEEGFQRYSLRSSIHIKN